MGKYENYSRRTLGLANNTWKVSKYGPEKTPYLGTFHAVKITDKISEGGSYSYSYSNTFSANVNRFYHPYL